MKICLKCRKMYEADLQFCTEDGNVLVNRDYCTANTEKKSLSAGSNQLFKPTMVISIPPHYATKTRKKSKRNLRVGMLSLIAFVILLSCGFVWAGIHKVVANIAAENVFKANNTSVAELKPKKSDD